MKYHFIFVFLFLLGFYIILTKRSLIKFVLGLNIMEASVLFWIISINNTGGDAPIFQLNRVLNNINDPLPHALALTAIVISSSTTALILSFIMELCKKNNIIDIDKLKGLDD
jgi:multicomponent Na+:H+ antiporter subunit C